MKIPILSLRHFFFLCIVSGLAGSSACKAPTTNPEGTSTAPQSPAGGIQDSARDTTHGQDRDPPSFMSADSAVLKTPGQTGTATFSDSATKDTTHGQDRDPPSFSSDKARVQKSGTKLRSAVVSDSTTGDTTHGRDRDPPSIRASRKTGVPKDARKVRPAANQ
jgi:hypothetical protein